MPIFKKSLAMFRSKCDSKLYPFFDIRMRLTNVCNVLYQIETKLGQCTKQPWYRRQVQRSTCKAFIGKCNLTDMGMILKCMMVSGIQAAKFCLKFAQQRASKIKLEIKFQKYLVFGKNISNIPKNVMCHLKHYFTYIYYSVTIANSKLQIKPQVFLG